MYVFDLIYMAMDICKHTIDLTHYMHTHIRQNSGPVKQRPETIYRIIENMRIEI